MARPPGTGLKLTEELRTKFLALIEAGIPPARASAQIGVDHRTVKRTAGLDPTFAEAIRAAEEIAVAPVEDKLMEMALSGHFDSIKLILQSRAASRWAPAPKRTELTVSGTVELAPAGSTNEDRINELLRRLQERAELAGDIEDAEVVEQRALPPPSTLDVDHVPQERVLAGHDGMELSE